MLTLCSHEWMVLGERAGGGGGSVDLLPGQVDTGLAHADQRLHHPLELGPALGVRPAHDLKHRH